MNDITSPEEFKKRLKLLEDDIDRIDFLEKYLKEHSSIPLELLAFIYESLGELHNKTGRPKGSFYQKAASTWEMVSVLRDNDKDIPRDRSNALKQAVKNYQKAFAIYRRQNYLSGLEETKEKIGEVRQELRSYGGYGKTISLLVVVIIFFSSFLFLLSPPTGFVIAPLDTGGTTLVGFVLVFLGIVGMFFILRKWY